MNTIVKTVKQRTPEEIEAYEALLKSDTLQGRTARLLDSADAKDYTEELRHTMSGYVLSENFQECDAGQQSSWLWNMTLLLEYISQLDKP